MPTSFPGPDPANRSAFRVVTHARKEFFFLGLWARYYGAIFGPENLVVVKDGADWDLPEGHGFGRVEVVDFPRDRRSYDLAFAQHMSQLTGSLLSECEVVLRVDVDEFLLVDPEKGTWDDLIPEVQRDGYVYSLGLDLVQNDATEGPLDLSRPILGQRNEALVSGFYCKPNAISRPVDFTSACHAIEGKPVILSESLILVHLASADRAITLRRFEERSDAVVPTWQSHSRRRLSEFDRVKNFPLRSYDEMIQTLREKVAFDENGDRALHPYTWRIFGKRYVKLDIPHRFRTLL